MTERDQGAAVDLVRMGDVVQLREDSQSKVGTLAGYFARFNDWTEINNPVEGHFRERLAPGAFTKTLAERGKDVQVLFNHGLDPQVGSKPLGVPSVMREDDQGVYVEVPLDDTSYNRDIAASLRSGALRGQSFRFRGIREQVVERGESGLPEVTCTEVQLKEFGPVTFPAYAGTSVALRSLYGAPVDGSPLDRLVADVEALRAGAILSKKNATLVVAARDALTELLDAAFPRSEDDAALLATKLRAIEARLREVA